MRLRASIAALTGMLIMALQPAHGETIQLSKIGDETATYIQRGNQGNNVECYWFILDRVEKRGIPDKDVYVTFDDQKIDGIGIGFADTDESYTCENGELRAWSEEGRYVVERSF